MHSISHFFFLLSLSFALRCRSFLSKLPWFCLFIWFYFAKYHLSRQTYLCLVVGEIPRLCALRNVVFYSSFFVLPLYTRMLMIKRECVANLVHKYTLTNKYASKTSGFPCIELKLQLFRARIANIPHILGVKLQVCTICCKNAFFSICEIHFISFCDR